MLIFLKYESFRKISRKKILHPKLRKSQITTCVSTPGHQFHAYCHFCQTTVSWRPRTSASASMRLVCVRWGQQWGTSPAPASHQHVLQAQTTSFQLILTEKLASAIHNITSYVLLCRMNLSRLWPFGMDTPSNLTSLEPQSSSATPLNSSICPSAQVIYG